MKNIGIFYGSSTGTCEDLASRIAEALGVSSSNVYSADKLDADTVAKSLVSGKNPGGLIMYNDSK